MLKGERIMERASIEIMGMSCGNCVAHVTRTLASIDGVRAESVAIGSAVVSFDPAKIEPAAIARALSEDGYPARIVSEGSTH
jgi:copper chaperone CopZ